MLDVAIVELVEVGDVIAINDAGYLVGVGSI
jgi:hypothetical protein